MRNAVNQMLDENVPESEIAEKLTAIANKWESPAYAERILAIFNYFTPSEPLHRIGVFVAAIAPSAIRHKKKALARWRGNLYYASRCLLKKLQMY